MTAWSIFGFRTAAGYGLVWRTDSDATSNLFSMNLDLDFKGGAERALPSAPLLSDIDVVPVPDGFVVATCSRDSESQWIHLGRDLTATAGASLVAPAAPCKEHAPGIMWTGERYLTSFTDRRGLVVAALDAKGIVAAEVVLSAGVTESVLARFSKNQDRVLFAYNEKNSGRGLSVVLTLAGTPIGDVQAFGKEDSHVTNLAISPLGDGWLVASDSWITNDNGLLLTVISRDGLVGTETRAFGTYPRVLESTPSAYGGTLVVGYRYTGGQYGKDEKFAVLVDEAGRVVTAGKINDRAFLPVGVIVDPQRDLVIEKPMGADAEDQPLTVQEYGCLD
jgi:hypothetical protein